MQSPVFRGVFKCPGPPELIFMALPSATSQEGVLKYQWAKQSLGGGWGEASPKGRFLGPISRDSLSGLCLGNLHFLIGYTHPFPIISNSGDF